MLIFMNTHDFSPHRPWWQGTTIYQIYPRSFQDSTGNGLGDIPGIISRLDYLKWLGVETIWLSPVYKSPQKDFGYDISDYREIEPDYGTMADMDRLIDETHRRDMKLVMDMVLNHSSDQHTWFIESASSMDNPRRDWYVWHPGRGKHGEKTPNNWQSQVSGKGWHKHPATGQWFWASFLPFQPDLNWRNPEVEAEMMDTLRFWLDKGVDGFRLDILGSVFETEGFPNNPRNHKLLPDETQGAMGLFHSSTHTQNHPDNFTLARRLRKLTDEYDPPRFMVGEVFGSSATVKSFCGDNEADGLHTVFLFHGAEMPFKATEVSRFQQETEETFHPPFQGCLALSNHDRARHISLIGEEMARLNALWQLTERLIPCLYFGEEIGMPQGHLNHKDSLDAVSEPFRFLPPFLFNWLNKKIHGAINRDECRQPMTWNSNENRGFTDENVRSWLPANTLPSEGAMEDQREKQHSLLHYYRELIHLRRNNSALSFGKLEVIQGLPKNIAGYKRWTKEQKLVIFLNFSTDLVPVPRDLEKANLLFSSQKGGNLNDKTIPPLGGVVLDSSSHN